jgi:hypothetical protein
MDVPEIALVRQRDESVVLRVTRADGTVVWQKQRPAHAAFFALHDLTHYAVESVLGVDDAFYGLLMAGWSFRDTEGKGARGRLPVNALFVEAIVGTLDIERASGARWSAAEFNESLAMHMAGNGLTPPRRLTDDDLARIRRDRAELFQRWASLAPGTALALRWDVPLARRDGTAATQDRAGP